MTPDAMDAYVDGIVRQIDERRATLKMRKGMLATAAGIAASTMKIWQTPNRTLRRHPNLQTIIRLADVLGMDVALVPRGDRRPQVW